MTRVTPGLYRVGVRDGGARLSTTPGFDLPTPFPTASAAIVRHHREGPQAAWRVMDDSYRTSSYWGASGTSQAGWANAMRACYRTYQRLARDDDRRSFAEGLNRSLEFPPHELGVYIDVVLLDEDGYVPRVVLWDQNDLTPHRAALYAAPVWKVLEDELGEDRIKDVEVWHLRTGTTRTIDPHQAADHLDDVEQIVRRLVT